MSGSQATSIVYLLGYPAVGKYTIACELARQTGAVVIDNQLINHPILALFKWDCVSELPPGTLARAGPIREAVLRAMEEIAPPEFSYVLTNVLSANDRSLYERIRSIARARDSIFQPVFLTCEADEQMRRVTEPSRRARYKLADPAGLRELMDNYDLLVPDEEYALHLDTSTVPPGMTAARIVEHIAQRAQS